MKLTNSGQFLKDDLTGKRFGRLVVLSEAEPRRAPSGITYKWLCQCDCGNPKVISGSHLRSGNTRSCGCLARELSRSRNAKHGHTRRNKISRTWISWRSMIERCNDPHHKSFMLYGGRGIVVSERWLGEHGFENFLADMGERPKGKTLDRYPNPNGNYEPGNCRWATRKEQHGNKSTNVWLEYNGRKMILADWARELNIPQSTLQARLKSGWLVEKALTS